MTRPITEGRLALLRKIGVRDHVDFGVVAHEDRNGRYYSYDEKFILVGGRVWHYLSIEKDVADLHPRGPIHARYENLVKYVRALKRKNKRRRTA